MDKDLALFHGIYYTYKKDDKSRRAAYNIEKG